MMVKQQSSPKRPARQNSKYLMNRHFKEKCAKEEASAPKAWIQDLI
jgi:hypothetical protein